MKNTFILFTALLPFCQVTPMFLDLEKTVGSLEKSLAAKNETDSQKSTNEITPETKNAHSIEKFDEKMHQSAKCTDGKDSGSLESRTELIEGGKQNGLLSHAHRQRNDSRRSQKSRRNGSRWIGASKRNRVSKKGRAHSLGSRRQAKRHSKSEDSLKAKMRGHIDTIEKRIRHSSKVIDHSRSRRNKHGDRSEANRRDQSSRIHRNHSRHQDNIWPNTIKFQNHWHGINTYQPHTSSKRSVSVKKHNPAPFHCHCHKADCSKPISQLKTCQATNIKLINNFDRLHKHSKLQTDNLNNTSKALKESQAENKRLSHLLHSEKKANESLEDRLKELCKKHEAEVKALSEQIARLKEISHDESQKITRLEKELVFRDRHIKEADENLTRADEIFAKKLKEQEREFIVKMAMARKMHSALNQQDKILVGASLE
jgi:hypothetical protein